MTFERLKTHMSETLNNQIKNKQTIGQVFAKKIKDLRNRPSAQ